MNLAKEVCQKHQYFDLIHRLMVKKGVEFVPSTLPEGVELGEPKNCFANAGRIALYDKELKYVEGVCVRKDFAFPFHHAWLTDGVHAFDVTIADSENYDYVGVVFEKKELQELIFKNEYWGVFSNDICFNVDLFEKLSEGITEEHKKAFHSLFENNP